MHVRDGHHAAPPEDTRLGRILDGAASRAIEPPLQGPIDVVMASLLDRDAKTTKMSRESDGSSAVAFLVLDAIGVDGHPPDRAIPGAAILVEPHRDKQRVTRQPPIRNHEPAGRAFSSFEQISVSRFNPWRTALDTTVVIPDNRENPE